MPGSRRPPVVGHTEATEFISTDTKPTQRQLDKRVHHVMDPWIATTEPTHAFDLPDNAVESRPGWPRLFRTPRRALLILILGLCLRPTRFRTSRRRKQFAVIVHIQIAITRLQCPLWFYLVTEKAKNLIIELRARTPAAYVAPNSYAYFGCESSQNSPAHQRVYPVLRAGKIQFQTLRAKLQILPKVPVSESCKGVDLNLLLIEQPVTGLWSQDEFGHLHVCGCRNYVR
jgi:hypothetical protein